MFRKIRLILWKNLVIRKRHWVLTFTEILIPVLLFSLVAYGRSKISGINKIYVDKPTYYEVNTLEDIYSHLDVGELNLWYSPYTDYTEQIIIRVQEKLQIRGDAVQGFTSKKKLLEHFGKNGTSLTAAVNFILDDFRHLNYELSIYDKYFSWNTDKLFSSMFIREDIGSSKYMYKGFAALQLALDMAFLELFQKKGQPDIAFSTQEFPDPPQIVDSGLNQLFMYFLPLITIFSFIFLCPAVLQRVGEEKCSGIKELMKMVGMKSWMIWFGWFIHGLVTNLLSIILIVILVKVPFWGVSYPPIEHSDFMVLFVFLFLYCMAAITFCFFIASIFNTPSISTVIGIMIWIFSYFIPQAFVRSRDNLTWKCKISTAIFPNMALYYGYSSISIYEMREVGIQWYNIFQPGSGSEDDVTMGNVFLMLIFDMVIFMLLTVYIENVKPGEYGIAQPYLFPLINFRQWMKKCFNNQRVENTSESKSLNNKDVEQGKSSCIQIHNLCKKFYNHIAVDNLNMDIYKNQITILLGHNGAGKTTTMSVLTGMINATSGYVTVDGKDIKKDTEHVRRIMGLCPQHNLLFPDLSVIEQLQFFAMLREASNPKIEAEEMLRKLGIFEKEKVMAHTLSGGMKRKLCLGMALIGNSEVLILDEPTSGMDPESRRKIWDLLIQYRRSKTILVTTHFMEEADVLGDWIAIMANGRLQCYDTPMRLKIKYNTGYHLSLMLKHRNSIGEITKVVKQNIPKAELIRESEDTLVYLLPLNKELYGVNYRHIFRTLENKKSCWGIITIGLNLTTLNDVFLKAKDEVDGKDGTTVSDSGNEAFKIYPDLQGVKRTWNNMCSLLTKRIYFFKKKYYWFIPSVFVAISIFLLSVWLGMSSENSKDHEPQLNLTLEIYGKTQVYYGGQPTSSFKLKKLREYYSENVLREHGRPIFQNDVSKGIIQLGTENIAFYKKHLVVAAEFNNSDNGEILVNAMYSPNSLHGLPISINLAMNALVKTLLNESFAISISNVPIKSVYSNQNPLELSVVNVMTAWLILVPISMLFFTSNFIIFPHTEVSTNFLQIQTIAGVKTYVYWFSNIVFDFILTIPQLLLLFMAMALVNWLAFDSKTFDSVEMVTIIEIFLWYSITSLPFTYTLSYRKTLTGGFTLLLMLGIFIGIVPSIIVIAMELSHQEDYTRIAEGLKHTFFIISPQFGLNYITVKFARKYVENFNWRYMDPNKRNHICHTEPNPCCYGEKTVECYHYKNYFFNNELGFFYDFLEMFIPFVIYFLILLFLNTEHFKKILHHTRYFPEWLCYKKEIGDEEKCQENFDVTHTKNNTLFVNDLTKTFGRKAIVKNLKLQLKKNKCLGLLGVNGAGKSTTFRMLTKNLFFDKGEITLSDDYPISINQPKYCEKIGYCPQEDCFNYFLTGRELLFSLARLKGYSPRKANEVTKYLTQYFGLEEYEEKPCSEYSGGNKRKLSTCIAFLGHPKVILLDEPTSGVDPASRRDFWNVLSSFKKNDTSFLLCSHSMEECENLCDEIAIMKDGKIRDQGSLLALKSKYQKGFKIVIKLKYQDGDISSVRDTIVSNLDVDVLEEYGESLEYQIKDNSKTLDELFELLEKLKDQNGCIEDYIISQISLEDIFLSVAEGKVKGRKKSQKEDV